jgi:hypothetical protein
MWGVKEERARNVETVSSSRNGANRGLVIYGRPPGDPAHVRVVPEGMTFDLYRWALEIVNGSFQKKKFYKIIWQKV